MRIGNQFAAVYPKYTKPVTQQTNTFTQSLQSTETATKTARTDTHSPAFKVQTPKENTLFGNKTGNYSYAKDSTEENPIILVEGYDSQGNRFEQKVNVNEVNPYNATEMEMTALGVHTGKIKGLESTAYAMPLDRKPMEMNERTNFIALFSKNISNQKILGQHQYANKLKSNMDFYASFWNSKK